MDEISKQVLQENKARQIFRKPNISYPLIRTRTYACVSGGKFGRLYFLVTPFPRFDLLPYCRRILLYVAGIEVVTSQFFQL